MAGCEIGIGADLINDCSAAPISGTEEVLYVFNKEEVTATFSLTSKTTITDLAVLVGKKGYKLQGYKKSTNPKSTLVVSDTLPDSFTQDIDFAVWGKDATTVEQLIKLGDVMVVAETKDKGLNGASAFKAYGVDSGLFKSALTQDTNADNGIFKLTLSAMEQRAPYYTVYDTSYAVTKAMLEALLVVQN